MIITTRSVYAATYAGLILYRFVLAIFLFIYCFISLFYVSLLHLYYTVLHLKARKEETMTFCALKLVLVLNRSAVESPGLGIVSKNLATSEVLATHR